MGGVGVGDGGLVFGSLSKWVGGVGLLWPDCHDLRLGGAYPDLRAIAGVSDQCVVESSGPRWLGALA